MVCEHRQQEYQRHHRKHERFISIIAIAIVNVYQGGSHLVVVQDLGGLAQTDGQSLSRPLELRLLRHQAHDRVVPLPHTQQLKEQQRRTWPQKMDLYVTIFSPFFFV